MLHIVQASLELIQFFVRMFWYDSQIWVSIDRVDPGIVLFTIYYVDGYPHFVVEEYFIMLNAVIVTLTYLIEVKLTAKGMKL